MKRNTKQLDIYSELCPASSATVIGAGLITMTLGSPPAGIAFVLAGVAVGVIGTVTKSFKQSRRRKG